MSFRLTFPFATLHIALMASCGTVEMEDPGRLARDLEAFRAWLAKNHPGKRWHAGPDAVDGAAIHAAYGSLRFYRVSSAPPVPPGASLPRAVDEYQKRLKAFRESSVSATVSIDPAGTILPVELAADYNRGLMKVSNQRQARVAAAAVLSLVPDDYGNIEPVTVDDLESGEGWTFQVNRPASFFAQVTFAADGTCTALQKRSPPRPGGR